MKKQSNVWRKEELEKGENGEGEIEKKMYICSRFKIYVYEFFYGHKSIWRCC